MKHTHTPHEKKKKRLNFHWHVCFYREKKKSIVIQI